MVIDSSRGATAAIGEGMEEGKAFRVGQSTVDGIGKLTDTIASRLMNTNPHQATPEQGRAALCVRRAVKCADDARRYAQRAHDELIKVDDRTRVQSREKAARG